MLKDIKRQEQLRLWLEVELNDWFGDRILPIDAAIADKWGYLQGEVKRIIPAIGSLLAATALVRNLRLVTCNIDNCLYPSLEIICLWHFYKKKLGSVDNSLG